jgi:hypothetical protein
LLEDVILNHKAYALNKEQLKLLEMKKKNSTENYSLSMVLKLLKLIFLKCKTTIPSVDGSNGLHQLTKISGTLLSDLQQTMKISMKTISCWVIEILVFGSEMRKQTISWHSPLIPMMTYMGKNQLF